MPTGYWSTIVRWLAALAVVGMPTIVHALSIELKDAAPDRVERQRAAALGRLPLPGTPDTTRTAERLSERGMKLGASALVRIFKEESSLEVWLEKDGRFELFASYPICHWSGTLGPKVREGDKQTPEGFYTITSRQLHRIGRWPRALNLGFPNAFDQAHKRSGSYILVHGGCTSVGCFAMTNPVMTEIYGIVSAALRGGQRHVPVHVFPFRLTEDNFAKYKSSEWAGFWRDLKVGYDSFERTRLAPRVSVCDGRYQLSDGIASKGPSEAGVTGPLAVCGATAAALRDRDKSVSLVPLAETMGPGAPIAGQGPTNPRETPTETDRRPLADPLGSRASTAAALASSDPISTDLMYEVVPNLVQGGRERADAPSKPPCNTGLPSCRKFLALRAKKTSRLAAVRSR
ncbi:MAG: murein L,D-transpeptidase family protein [Hyphomicrobium sp.]|nr:murein L,D-transpeptidase family protein [Hyphomicrobium sp.]